MSETLPQRSIRHATGERGLAILKLKLPTTWIVRNQNESDYGIDVEVEIANKTVTGKIFKAQVRTKTPIHWRSDSTFREPFGSGKLLYWKSIKLPVVLFLVDNSEGKVFWEKASGEIPADASLPEEIIVSKSSDLSSTVSVLENYVTSFTSHLDALKVMYRLPFFLEVVKNRQENKDLDCHMALEHADLNQLNFIYGETELLVQALGLSEVTLIPWQLWQVRSTTIFGANAELHNGIHDEMLDYLEPVIEKIKAIAKEIVEREPLNPVNFLLKNAVSSEQFDYVLPVTAPYNREYWVFFEDGLAKRKAKRYSALK